MSNPWTLPDARAHHVALGGLRAFVQRNDLEAATETDASSSPYSSSYSSSSVELIRGLRLLLAKKTSVLAVRALYAIWIRKNRVYTDICTRDEQLTRELETLERQVACAGCLLPQQLRLRVEGASALCTQLQELLTLKPALLHALRRSAEPEAIDVEMKHQRAFIALFLKIGDELQRRAPVLSTLDGMALIASDLAVHQREFERVVMDLATTIAAYRTLCDDIAKLRVMYSRLQNETARVQTPGRPQLSDSTPSTR